jgi:hypothetical protein
MAGGGGYDREAWYAPEIRRFVRLDRERPPAPGGVLFVGSSIFSEWRENGRAVAWQILLAMSYRRMPLTSKHAGSKRVG